MFRKCHMYILHFFLLFLLKVGDFDKIWREHCEDERTLSEYALAMKNLADQHWTKKCDGEGRIEWCRRYDSLPQPPLLVTKEPGSSSAPLPSSALCSVCQEYFLNGGMKRMLEKDEKSAKFAAGVTGSSVSGQPFSATPRSALTSHSNFSALYTSLKSKNGPALPLLHCTTTFTLH